MILSREVRHSILKITPGGSEKESAAGEALNDDMPETTAQPQITPARLGGGNVPADASSADLHQRHVDAEHQLHAHNAADAAEQPKQTDLPL